MQCMFVCLLLQRLFHALCIYALKNKCIQQTVHLQRMLQLAVLSYFESGIFTLTTLYIALTKKKRMFSLWKICKRKAKCQHLSRIWTQGPCLKPPLFWPLTCNHWTIEVCAIIFVLHCSWHIPALLWRNMLHLSMSMRELQLRLAACLPYKSTGGHSHVTFSIQKLVELKAVSWVQILGL